MRIQYKKKIVKSNLILGIVWLLLGIVQMVVIEDSNPFHYAWFVMAGI